jgi:hypothetical protein
MSFHQMMTIFLHGVGIFRVQPGVVEVCFVEDTRELGKLQ